MPYILDDQDEAFVQAQLAAGRFRDATEVLHAALRLLERHERQRAALDAAIQEGIDAAAAGEVYELDDVFDEIIAEIEGHQNRGP